MLPQVVPLTSLACQLNESECDVMKDFMSRLMYLQDSVKSESENPESEISSHVTLTSVISGLFYGTAVVCTRDSNSWFSGLMLAVNDMC